MILWWVPWLSTQLYFDPEKNIFILDFYFCKSGKMTIYTKSSTCMPLYFGLHIFIQEHWGTMILSFPWDMQLCFTSAFISGKLNNSS